MNNTEERNFFSNLNYSGKVLIKIEKNGKIISKKSYHNAGTDLLWKFISYCLAGKYQSAEDIRPKYIKLFKNSNAPGEGLNTKNIKCASDAILISSSGTPQVWTETDESNNKQVLGYKTVLQFLIPYSFITESEINEVRIYGKINKDVDEACSAYFQFVKDYTETIQWDPVEIEEPLNNYNLIVEWEMRISNLIKEEIN